MDKEYIAIQTKEDLQEEIIARAQDLKQLIGKVVGKPAVKIYKEIDWDVREA